VSTRTSCRVGDERQSPVMCATNSAFAPVEARPSVQDHGPLDRLKPAHRAGDIQVRTDSVGAAVLVVVAAVDSVAAAAGRRTSIRIRCACLRNSVAVQWPSGASKGGNAGWHETVPCASGARDDLRDVPADDDGDAHTPHASGVSLSVARKDHLDRQQQNPFRTCCPASELRTPPNHWIHLRLARRTDCCTMRSSIRYWRTLADLYGSECCHHTATAGLSTRMTSHRLRCPGPSLRCLLLH